MAVYFDNAATTMVRDESIETMNRVMRYEYGNPSSIHAMGRNAARELETARKRVADAIGAKADEIYFTSGGTEADNWAILGCAKALSRYGKHMITSSIEHDAVLEPAKELEKMGWDVTYLTPDSSGKISVESFSEALREDTTLASVMLVNNEIGVINPIHEYSSVIKQRGLNTIIHSDAVQGLCKIPFSVKTLGADLITFSAHKIHGPKGIGALYIKDGTKLTPLILGGGQEKGKRSGTEALPMIAGFGEAARLGKIEQEETMSKAHHLKEYITIRLLNELPDVVIIGDNCSPFIVSLSMPGVGSEVLMSFLESEGIYVSNSAACKKGARSKVLMAMRLKNEVVDGAVRISFSRYNTVDEAEYFISIMKIASKRLIRRNSSIPK